jgi:hypothetical protein
MNLDCNVEKNMFSDQQIKHIKNLINNKFKTLSVTSKSEEDMMNKNVSSDIMIEEALGRARYHVQASDLGDDILQTLSEILKKYNNNLNLSSITFASYASKYGTPKLPPHMDKHDNNVTVFYQLESNVDWPLFIQQESATLKDNEGLILNTRNSIHWREPRLFSDGEFTNMLFFHFYDGTKSMLTVQDRYDLPKSWFDIYNRISIEKNGRSIL